MKPCFLCALFFVGFWRLSAQTQVPSDRDGLEKGEGMGMATPAETNGFPGPKHVLELKDRLGLTPDQIAKTEAAFAAVKATAGKKGKEIIKAEETLAEMFKRHTVEEEQMRATILEIARLRGELRFIHLQAHLQMVIILTPEQVKQYTTLRNHARNH